MYKSRLFVTNGIVSIELDALNGELLAFVREDTDDNAIKNQITECTGIIDGILAVEGKEAHLNVPRYAQIRADSTLTPKINTECDGKSGRATIEYPYLVADGKKTDISAKVEIVLREGECRTEWKLQLDNRSGCEIVSCVFPQMIGLWLGESYEEDTLILPNVSGSTVKYPTKALATRPVVVTWKWQEYLHRNVMTGRYGRADNRGIYTLEAPYTGGGSMLWADLYSKEEGTGIYITCRDSEMKMKAVTAHSLGEYCPGIGMGIKHYPCISDGKWESESCIVAFHSGDWHWAADEYRSYRESIDRPKLNEDPVPQWFKESPGLMAHYDFQYQGGGIVHRFSDIPYIYEKAKKLGFNHILISGWHREGFDYGFPLYTPNELLGTREELRDSIAKVKADGGHVSFYVNSRLCNTAFEENKERIEKSAVMKRDGSLHIEKYGAGDVSFSTLCIGDPEWRGALCNDIVYMIKEMGADSVYLDQLAMTESRLCYHPGHKEHENAPSAWNQGYEKLLAELRERVPGTAVLYEGCCDIYGKGVSGQLISTLRMPFAGTAPEVYKYTFPGEILMDMMNPRRHSGMRAEHIARHSTDYLFRAFVCGSYLWCYDLEGDNTFSRDKEQEARLVRTAALRKEWLKRYGHGIFRDTIGLCGDFEDKLIKLYEIENGVLIAAADKKQLSGKVTFEWNGGEPKAEVMTDSSPVPVQLEAVVEQLDGKKTVTVTLPAGELAVIAVTEK